MPFERPDCSTSQGRARPCTRSRRRRIASAWRSSVAPSPRRWRCARNASRGPDRRIWLTTFCDEGRARPRVPRSMPRGGAQQRRPCGFPYGNATAASAPSSTTAASAAAPLPPSSSITRSRTRGGPNAIENVRLRCRAHNTLAAEQDFGRAFVERKKHGARHDRRSDARADA